MDSAGKIEERKLKTGKKFRNEKKKVESSAGLLCYRMALKLLGLGFGLLHGWHVSTLFENDRHFSHLSDIEREMSFRTEMGMYYYYYKTLVEFEDFELNLQKIKKDNISEYPNVIDATQKYYILPERFAGAAYHTVKFFGLLPEPQCWQVDRGVELPPVTSCEGLGVPIYFYLEIVWYFATSTGAIIFLYATYLSDSIYGGLLAILSFFYNHNECTRVQWTPPLRESFAYPLLLYQMYKITQLIREDRELKTKFERIYTYIDIIMTMTFCFLTWQFSQFIFLTQIIVLLLLQWLKIIPRNLNRKILICHISSTTFPILIEKKVFLAQSLYWIFLHVNIYSELLCRKIFRFFNSSTIMTIEIISTILFTILIKFYLIESEDDRHIFSLLKSKLFNYKDFNTMLYTCSPEFDFLQYGTYRTIIMTALLPTVILAGLITLYYWYRNFTRDGYTECIEPGVAYNFLQCAVFVIMAVLIMRLKLFMTPHLCIIAGLVAGKRYLGKFGIKSETSRGALIFLILALMSYNGIQEFQRERNHIGEYIHPEQEELFEWIKAKTPKSAVFAGKMSLMANLMLSTGRPIVNNPYYENKEMRDRTMKVYQIYGRKKPAAVYEILKNLYVDYVILDEQLCLNYGNMKSGCRMVDLMDLLDKGKDKEEGKSPVCPQLFQSYNHLFRRVFSNEQYVVLSLEYTKYVEIRPIRTISY